MSKQKTKQTDKEDKDLRDAAAIGLANKFLGRATLGEALSLIPLNAVIQLCQNKALEQGKSQVEEMKTKELENLLQEIEKARAEQEAAQKTANSAVEEIKNENVVKSK